MILGLVVKKEVGGLLLFCDIVTLILFRENVTYEKRGTISHDRKRDGKT